MKISNIVSRRNRILLRELVITDFKLRYQGSILGYLWSLLKPLLLFGILYIVFGEILRFGKGIPYYPVYLLMGVVLWNFFTEATRQGMTAIVSRGSLLRKINFPKYIVVFSATISALINLGLNIIVIGIFIVISGAEIQMEALILFPLVIIELYILSLAVAFFLAAANVKYRDVSHIWDVFIQAGFYATPIIYPISMVIERSEWVAKLMILNPIAQVIQDSRYLLTTSASQTLFSVYGTFTVYLIPLTVVAMLSIIASFYFKKRSKYFTEDL